MATNDKGFIGGASKVAQVDDGTPASVTSGNIFKVELDSEPAKDGTTTTQEETFTATAATVANVTAGITDAVNTSTKSLFQLISAQDQTTKVRFTAKHAGVSFRMTLTSADGSGSAGHSFTKAGVTDNSGPYAYEVPANWLDNTVPDSADTDRIKLMRNPNDGKSYSLLFDLDQNGAAPLTFTTADDYDGHIGALRGQTPGQLHDTYLVYDTSASTDCELKGTGAVQNIRYGGDETNIRKTARSSTALQLAGTLGTIQVLDNRVIGTILVTSGSGLTRVRMIEGPGAVVICEGSLSTFGGNDCLVRAGKLIIKPTGSSMSSFDITQTGGVIEYFADDGAAFTSYGGILRLNGGGTITTVTVDGGHATIAESAAAALTITNRVVRAGVFDARGTPTLTVSNDTKTGGTVLTSG